MRLTAVAIATALSAIVLSAGSHVAHAATQPNTNSKDASQTVTINPGDTLTAISEAHGSTVERVYSANTQVDNPDLIYPGDTLRIPSAAEALTMRALPAPAASAPVAAPVAAPAEAAPVAAPVAAPTRTYSAPAAAPVASGSVWDELAHCESGGNWAINTGNGFYGGLQFTIGSWAAMGGSGLPSDASRSEQIARAQSLQAVQGWGAWPACSAKLGLL